MTASKIKYGTVREDGMVFFQYTNYGCGERWVTPETFAKYAEKYRKYQSERRSDPLYRELQSRYKRSEEVKARTKTPEARAKRNARRKAQYDNDPLCAISSRVRSRLAKALVAGGFPKKSNTPAIIGCSFEELKAHLESQFVDGMTWENRSEWHVDHETPLASATTEEELLKLCHYTNLQPLWAKDNLSKGAKILN